MANLETKKTNKQKEGEMKKKEIKLRKGLDYRNRCISEEAREKLNHALDKYIETWEPDWLGTIQSGPFLHGYFREVDHGEIVIDVYVYNKSLEITYR